MRTLESELERAKVDLKFIVTDNERKVSESIGRVEAAEIFAEGEFKRLKLECDKAKKLYVEKVLLTFHYFFMHFSQRKKS